MHGMEFVVFLVFGMLILHDYYLFTLWKSAKGPNLAKKILNYYLEKQFF